MCIRDRLYCMAHRSNLRFPLVPNESFVQCTWTFGTKIQRCWFYVKNACIIWTYDRQIFSSDMFPSENLAAPTAHCTQSARTTRGYNRFGWLNDIQWVPIDKEKRNTDFFSEKVCQQWDCNLQHIFPVGDWTATLASRPQTPYWEIFGASPQTSFP